LDGDYVGATAGATVGVGIGANALIGGGNKSIALQPLSFEGNTGLNVAAGVGALSLHAEAAAPPPPPPPPVKTFIVFFDFDRSDLTSSAVDVITEAVRVAKANGFVKVLVTGHTDTVGSDTYNMTLSLDRAKSVREEMVRQGMDGSDIAVDGKSFHDPLVPTGPDVKEPQNRRAVIDLGG
jgi:outer membrane protein OmpA-like peptidoglycan-associated protein